MEVVPKVSAACMINWLIILELPGSRPDVGSSYKTRSGSSTVARASAARFFMPPEISEGNLNPYRAYLKGLVKVKKRKNGDPQAAILRRLSPGL